MHSVWCAQPFDGGDISPVRRGRSHLTTAHRQPVHLHRAGPALGNPTTVFYTGDPQLIPQHPQQRHVIFDINIAYLAIYGDLHKGPLLIKIDDWTFFIHLYNLTYKVNGTKTTAMNDRDKKLIVAAHAVFSRYGVSKTTMHDIAREAGVARQTLYNAYPNKEAMLRAAVRVSAQETYASVETAWTGQTKLSEKIETFFQLGPLTWYDMVVASPEMGDLIDGIHTIAKDEMSEFAALWRERFERLIKDHTKPGSAAYEDAAATADFLYSTSVNAKLDAADRDTVESRLAILKRSVLALVAT